MQKNRYKIVGQEDDRRAVNGQALQNSFIRDDNRGSRRWCPRAKGAYEKPCQAVADTPEPRHQRDH
jgi:hypothetical protein